MTALVWDVQGQLRIKDIPIEGLVGTANERECTPEPTDMLIEFGEFINCTLDVRDTDAFRFIGSSGEKVLIEATGISGPGGTGVCIRLVNPDGIPAQNVCQDISARRVATLKRGNMP